MELKEALKIVRDGKKVRAIISDGDIILHKEEDKIFNEKGQEVSLLGWLLNDSTRFEIVDEKKTLSDKIITADGLHHEVKVCIEEDIKETFSNIKKDICKHFPTPSTRSLLMEIINKKIGARLI